MIVSGEHLFLGSSKSKTAHLDIIGDSLRGRIPEIENIFNDPSVAGALESTRRKLRNTSA